MIRTELWANADAIPEKRLLAGKLVLLTVIVFTSVLPMFFVEPDDAPLRVNLFKYLAKTGAFLGSMFLIWQFLLGFRGAISAVFPDLTWVIGLHKKLGQFGVPIVLLHPVFIGLYYAEVHGTNIFRLDLGGSFSWLVLMGMVALALIAFVVIASVFFRDKLGFYPWLYTHLSAYLVPPFMLVHSFLLGPTIQGTWLGYYWWGITAVVVAFCIGRLAHKLGAASTAYHVTQAREVAEKTTEIVMKPEGRGLRPAAGQFIYLRGSLPENAHPYSVSTFDDETGCLAVTVSEAGPQSARLQTIEAGDRLLLDGPYGVFTRPAMATGRKTVMIAGGIGITAFWQQLQRLETEADREVYLFYGNETYSDVAYQEELDRFEYAQIIHVLNQEDDFQGEQGLVTVDVLRRNLSDELTDYQFLLCGPPAMVRSLRDELAEAGVEDDHIRYELFST